MLKLGILSVGRHASKADEGAVAAGDVGDGQRRCGYCVVDHAPSVSKPSHNISPLKDFFRRVLRRQKPTAGRRGRPSHKRPFLNADTLVCWRRASPVRRRQCARIACARLPGWRLAGDRSACTRPNRSCRDEPGEPAAALTQSWNLPSDLGDLGCPDADGAGAGHLNRTGAGTVKNGMTRNTAERSRRALGQAASVIDQGVRRPERSHRLLAEPDLAPAVTYTTRATAQFDDTTRWCGR